MVNITQKNHMFTFYHHANKLHIWENYNIVRKKKTSYLILTLFLTPVNIDENISKSVMKFLEVEFNLFILTDDKSCET